MDEVGTDIAGFGVKLILLWNQAILNAAAKSNPNVTRDLVPKVNYAIQIQSPRFTSFPCWDSAGKPFWMFENFRAKAKLTLAQNLERCGRTQDAAKVFEELRMYDKARELRERDRHIIVKKTDVSVNLNALLQQVKDGGIVAIFRCPHCGGNLKISEKTTLNSLNVCEHCNSEIAAMDLADFLKSVLS
jgi:DNA-directed RNA polymerase subunit RPC12/RpoP